MLKKEVATTVRIISNNTVETVKAMNRVRVGEEYEITNMVEYLNNTTVRE